MEKALLLEALQDASRRLNVHYRSHIVEFPKPGLDQKGLTAVTYKAALIDEFRIRTSEADSAEREQALDDYRESAWSQIGWLEDEAPQSTHPYKFPSGESLDI